MALLSHPRLRVRASEWTCRYGVGNGRVVDDARKNHDGFDHWERHRRISYKERPLKENAPVETPTPGWELLQPARLFRAPQNITKPMRSACTLL